MLFKDWKMSRDRFEGVVKSYGPVTLEKLTMSHVAVVGLGGVGSWCVETLARTGIGSITLMDLDDICLSNTNRQIHAIEGSYGKMKSNALRERILDINPDCKVGRIEDFFDEKSCDSFFEHKFDLVIDCIDSAKNKSLLISECYTRKIPVITVGAAGGRKDPAKLQIIDLNKTYNDKLLMRVRQILKRKYKISKSGRNNLHIPCVFSIELVDFPDLDEQFCNSNTDQLVPTNNKLNCQGTMGSLMHITATMGIMAASIAINKIANNVDSK